MKHATRLLAAAALCLTAAAAYAQVELKPRVIEGSRHTDQTMTLKQSLKIAGQEIPTTAEVVTATTLTAQKPAADGTVRVVNKTDRMALKVEAPGFQLNVDTAKPDAAPADNPMTRGVIEMLKALAAHPYTLVLDPKGAVKAVEGVDQIIQGAGQETAEMLKRELALPKLQRETAQELGALPDKAVKKGDRWERSEVHDIGAGQTLTLQTFYEYDGVVERGGRKLDRVNIFIGDVKYAQDANVMAGAKVTRSDLKAASSLGAYYFDRETGEVVERTTNVRITGPMTMEVNGMELPAELDLTMDVSTVTKR